MSPQASKYLCLHDFTAQPMGIGLMKVKFQKGCHAQYLRRHAMIQAQEIWQILQTKVPQGVWISLHDIYGIGKHFGNLDNEDYEPQSPSSDIPK